jgi:type I restriction-modification system DNA methylase subunit
VQSEKFAEAHGGNKTDVSIFGQESNPTTWRLAHMNLAVYGIEANLGPTPADTPLRINTDTSQTHHGVMLLPCRLRSSVKNNWRDFSVCY